MRVLFASDRAGFFGGVEQSIAHAAAGLRARGHECSLAYGAEGRDAGAFRALFAGAWPVAELVAGGASRAPAPAGADRTRTLADAVATAEPDALFLHRLPSLSAVAPWLGRRRVVRMVHDHDLCCPRRHKYYAWTGRVCHRPAGWACWLDAAFLARDRGRRTGFRLVGLRAHRAQIDRHRALDALLVGSRFMRQELVTNGLPPERVHILPPVVPETGGPPTAVPAEPRLLYVGQLIRGKGVDLLLQALARLDVPYAAAIVGSGNAEAGLRGRAADLGLQGRVTFHGWIGNQDMAHHYRAARLVVVPSRWPEPFGMIGLEAMRHGRPVVGFAVGGIPDWLVDGETGLLAAEGDVAGLADCLRRLLADDALAAALGGRAAEVAAERFGYARYLDHLEAHLAGRHAGDWYERQAAG